MVLYNQLPIYRDSYLLLTEIYRITIGFPRDFKYTLGQDMKRDCLSLFRDLYYANMSVNNRRQHLDDFLAAFELLKIELRLCVDFNIMSIRKLSHISLLMDNIARQASAWRKNSPNKEFIPKETV